MNKKDTEAAFNIVGRSRSCANCEVGHRAAITTCRICFRESMKSFGKGIDYERKRRKAEDAVTPENLETEMQIAFGARARVIDGHRYVTVDWQGFQNIARQFYELGKKV